MRSLPDPYGYALPRTDESARRTAEKILRQKHIWDEEVVILAEQFVAMQDRLKKMEQAK